jgi:hypothetical protein
MAQASAELERLCDIAFSPYLGNVWSQLNYDANNKGFLEAVDNKIWRAEEGVEVETNFMGSGIGISRDGGETLNRSCTNKVLPLVN